MPNSDPAPATSVQSLEDTQTGKVNSVGQNKVLELPNLPKAPSANHKDMHQTSRHKRVEALAAMLDSESEQEAAERVSAGDTKNGVEREKSAEPNELQAGVAAAEDKAKSAGAITSEASTEEPDEEKRKETRRTETEAKVKEELLAPEPEEAKTEEKKPETASDKERRERFEKVLKLEAQANKQNEKLRQREEQVKRQEREFHAQRQEFERQWRAKAEQFDRDIVTAKEVLKLARENPLELLERAGAKPEDVARWVSDAADPVNRKLREMDARWAEMEARERALKEQEQRQRQQARLAEEQTRIESEFLGHFEEKDGEDFVFEPARLIYSRSELIRLGNEIAADASQMGQQFTTRDIAEAINEVAKGDERYKQIQGRITTKPAAAAPAAEAKPQPKVEAAKPAAPKPTIAVTNREAQDASPAPKQQPNRNYKDQRNNRLRKMFAGLDRE